ncbi:MAG: hypothetical protein OEW21_11455 [Betaproteobacteria bacterium]|nr:hypothetical protein [Betaproteobacteria bacterium]
MQTVDFLMIWPQQPLASLLALLLIVIPLLYAARTPVRQLFLHTSLLIANPLRLAARWTSSAATRLQERNRAVLFAHGATEVRLSIERDFERVSAIVQRDLEGYPALQRKLMDEITRIEEDYKHCAEVPPPPPEWVAAVEAVANVKASGDGVVEKILSDIRASLDGIYKKVLNEYRAAYQARHRILQKFLPFWRSVGQNLTRVERSVTGLQDGAARIDAGVAKLQSIFSDPKRAEHVMTVSASTQFFISALVMLIAMGGGFVNFKLIALPMSAMVGAGDYITGNLLASEVAALVIVLFETLMGLFLLESLRFTHLFPLGNLNEKMRRRLMWVSLTILLVLAGVEVALAVMRDAMIADQTAFKQALGAAASATAAATADSGWIGRIPTYGQMILGFTLPFALAFAGIPLEYLISAGRTVLGVGLVLMLRAGAFVLRLLSLLARESGKLLATLYDVLIFAPLAVERLFTRGRQPAVRTREAT